MNESIQKCKFQLQLLKRINLLNLYAHFTRVKFNVSYLNYIQTWWAGSNFTQFFHKTLFCAGFILHHNMEGLHFEIFDFYFLHWFMQCPSRPIYKRYCSMGFYISRRATPCDELTRTPTPPLVPQVSGYQTISKLWTGLVST